MLKNYIFFNITPATNNIFLNKGLRYFPYNSHRAYTYRSMVMQKRIGYGFNGYRIPSVPRASRSIRVKRSLWKRAPRNSSIAQNGKCGLDMLVEAAVADDQLQQKKSGVAQCDERKGEPMFYEGEQQGRRNDNGILSDPPEKGSVIGRVKIEFPTTNDIDKRISLDLKPPDSMSSYSSVVGPRIIKMLGPKVSEFSEKEKEADSLFYSRNMSYKHQIPQNFCLKDNKCFHSGPTSSDFPICSEVDIKGETSSSNSGVLGGGTEISSSTGAQKFDFDSDYHVQLRIGSFTVPDLVIHISKTATVGSLKRSVIDNLTTYINEAIVAEVHLQGKKMRDDSETLIQAGICHGIELGSLAITLAPSPKQCAPICHVPLCDSLQPLNRLPPITNGEIAGSHSPEAVSNALVSILPADMDSLCCFTVNGKVQRSEASQRRVRRPFSVSEVEALVHTVEKLGTGRWRDVKLRAFDNSKHRTYVDLKDKWKTLVHTAKIPPQRRRGEPVPQALLDRVLSVHSYWSEHQQPKLDALLPPC